jgi:N-acetyl-anhydromuramyl-L-alanine amidase AmpD
MLEDMQSRAQRVKGRAGSVVDKVVIHVTQGSFPSAYNWCQDPNANVSWQYLGSQRGHFAQQVTEDNAAYHAGNWQFNKTSVGIEHAGFIDDPGMWTDALMHSSAMICAGVVLRAEGIPNEEFAYHLYGHDKVPGADHRDPGQYFEWGEYLELVSHYMTPPAKRGGAGVNNNAGARPAGTGGPKKWHRVKVDAGQAGAFENSENADQLKRQLKELGVKARVQ